MRMKRYNLIIALLLAGAVLVFAEPQGIKKTFKVAKDAMLEVSLNPGEIIIKTWDKSEIGFYSEDMDESDWRDVEIREEKNSLYFYYQPQHGWGGDFNFTFFVPVSVNLRLNTTGGDIKIKDKIIGAVDIKTSGGDIKTEAIQGSLSANTSGGDIHVGDIAGDLNVNTSGGDIIIGKINGSNTEVSTMGGDIRIVGTYGDINARTYGGDIRIGDIGGNASATTFGGDVEFQNVSGNATMETYGGDLSLKSADGKVSADTKGGNISLKNVKGSLEAKTAGGDIYAELDPSSVGQSNLKSANGKIELRLSSSAKANIDAVVKLHGYNEDDSNIYSDFGGKPGMDKNKNTIYYKISINGGGQNIKITTVNSDIIIKKK